MIYVVSHKAFPYESIIDKKLYSPIFVGSGHEYAKQNGYLHDDSNDNISKKNKNYCELTALYWVWKNCLGDDFYGLNHYRRYFYGYGKNNGLLNVEDVDLLLKEYDVLLTEKLQFSETVEHYFYKSTGYMKDLYNLRNVMQELWPDYLNCFDDFLKGNEMSYANMFVIRKEYFSDYCSWLFSILNTLEERTSMEGYTSQEQRLYGYLGELLLNVYISKNNLKIKNVELFNTEINNISFQHRIIMRMKAVVRFVVYYPSQIPHRRRKGFSQCTIF